MFSDIMFAVNPSVHPLVNETLYIEGSENNVRCSIPLGLP